LGTDFFGFSIADFGSKRTCGNAPQSKIEKPKTKIEKMKSVRAKATLCALMVALTACSNLPGMSVLGDLRDIAATPIPSTPRVVPTAAPADFSTAALVKLRSKIRVGLRYDAPPLARVNADGELEGMDVDLARDFARRWLGSPRNVEFVQVTSLSAPAMIANREIDMAMGGLLHSKSAEPLVDFSLTTVMDGESLLARTGTFSDFLSLAGSTVTYIDSPSTFALRDAQIASNITVTLVGQNSYRAAVDDLIAGETDAVAGRWRRLRATATNDPALTILTVFSREPVAILLPQNDSAWADLVNLTFSQMVNDGTYDAAYEKWFGAKPELPFTLPQPNPPQLADLPNSIAPRDVISAMKAANAVRVGFNAGASPFSALNGEGQPEGFEVDVAREMARRWFNTPDAAQFSPASDAAAALAGGQADLVIGGIGRNGTTERLMDFSQTIFVSNGLPVAIAVPQESSALRDLVNFTLQEMQADGTYGAIFQKWFPDQPVNEIERWTGAGSSAALLAGPPQSP
jgi:putative glutamine transport system substrate-binding protein